MLSIIILLISSTNSNPIEKEFSFNFGDQLVDGFRPAVFDILRHAGADMLGQQLLAEGVEGRADGADLHQDIRAIGVGFHHLHLPHAPHLSLDTVEPVDRRAVFFTGVLPGLAAAAVASRL